jgi:hypothetical protein
MKRNVGFVNSGLKVAGRLYLRTIAWPANTVPRSSPAIPLTASRLSLDAFFDIWLA